jgi:hypothetical protein
MTRQGRPWRTVQEFVWHTKSHGNSWSRAEVWIETWIQERGMTATLLQRSARGIYLYGCFQIKKIVITEVGMRLSPLGTVTTIWSNVPAPDGRWWVWSSRWSAWQEKPKHSEKSSPSAALFTTNPIWPDLGSNPGRLGGKLATHRLSCRTAWEVKYAVSWPNCSYNNFIVFFFENLVTQLANEICVLDVFRRSNIIFIMDNHWTVSWISLT